MKIDSDRWAYTVTQTTYVTVNCNYHSQATSQTFELLVRTRAGIGSNSSKKSVLRELIPLLHHHQLKEIFLRCVDGTRIVSSKPFCSLKHRLITERNVNDVASIMTSHGSFFSGGLDFQVANRALEFAANRAGLKLVDVPIACQSWRLSVCSLETVCLQSKPPKVLKIKKINPNQTGPIPPHLPVSPCREKRQSKSSGFENSLPSRSSSTNIFSSFAALADKRFRTRELLGAAPNPMTTQNFGGAWGANRLTQEKKKKDGSNEFSRTFDCESLNEIGNNDKADSTRAAAQGVGFLLHKSGFLSRKE